MIELATVVSIASMAPDGVSAFDTIFRGFVDIVKKHEPAAGYVPPRDIKFADDAPGEAFVATSRQTGARYQVVTYAELQRARSREHRLLVGS